VAEAAGQWKASGLKVREFCEREGVTPTTFAHWRKEIAARDARRTTTTDPLFVPVRVAAVLAPLEVALPGGRVVRVPPAFDPAHLQAVVTALEGLSC
jgi:hypothetical protein